MRHFPSPWHVEKFLEDTLCVTRPVRPFPGSMDRTNP